MIHIRDEGQLIKPGINFYPLGRGSIGFIIKFTERLFRFRFSTGRKRFFIGWEAR